MRRARPVLVAATLALAPTLLAPACKPPAPGSPAATRRENRRAAEIELPAALPLPANPEMAAHIANPEEVISTFAAFSAQQVDVNRVATELLGGIQLPQFTAEVAGRVDGSRPWSAARVEGQNILHLPIRTGEVDALADKLAGYPSAGDFGAVELPAPEGVPAEAGGRRLAWLDRAASTLVVAGSERGLVTGSRLAATYGSRPLYFTVDRTGAQALGNELPAERVTMQGEGAHDFRVIADGVAEDRLRALAELSDGALTGLLDVPQIALGATTRWASHERAVKTVISQINRQVKEQNFLIRGVLEDLVKRLNAVLRKWNGRVLAGVGPKNHLLVSMGADDVPKAERAVLHLVGGVIDNLKLAKTFGLPVPSIKLRKAAHQAGDVKVHVLTLSRAADMLPPAARPLLDDNGRLRVAFAFPSRAGGGMMVVGPTPGKNLARWVEDAREAPSAAQSNLDLFAARVAVQPKTLAPALRQPDGLGALGLTADREPTRLLVRRRDATIELTVEGPRLEPPTAPSPKQTKPEARPASATAPGKQPLRGG